MATKSTNTRKTTRKPATKTARKPRAKVATKRTATKKKATQSSYKVAVGAKKVRLLVRTCPHRAGTVRAKKFACLKSGKSVNAILKVMSDRGLTRGGGYLGFAVRTNIVELTA